mgnify:FL=1
MAAALTAEGNKLWILYMIRARDQSLYTGITTDPERRLIEHNCSAETGAKGAKALRGKGPLKLVYQAEIGDRSEAQKMEYKVKQLSKAQKEALVSKQQPLLQFLEKTN